MLGCSALLLAGGFANFACAGEWFVATNGSDTNPGTQEQPFATLARARDEARKQKDAGGATVYVRGGLHTITQTLKFGPQDSGTAAAPVVFRAWKNEKPVLIGGRAITGFTPWKGSILKADVAAQGFKGIAFKQLFFDGRRQTLARYPNFDAANPYGGGWAYADGKPVPMYVDIAGEAKNTLHFKPQDARTWAQPQEVEVFVFARYNWWNNIVRIKSIEPGARLATLAANCSYPIRPGDRYYFQNALEELDTPGEWHLDAKAGTLYFWPPGPLAGKAVYAPTTRTILDLERTANVTFRGLTIECSEGTAVTFRGTTNCVLAGCTIRNAGDYNGSGVGVSGGLCNGVSGCDIYEVGSHGVVLDGGDRKTLKAAENFADNNYIHHIGVFYKQGVGVSLTGVGNRASHNLIHDGPRMGIMFSGNNLVLEYNHIRHMNLETEDTGAVYTGGRDWISSRGTVIRYNYFHDILGYGKDAKGNWVSPHFAWGVYLDDNTGGVDVIGNIVARCSRAGLHLHNGRDNLIANNVFIEGGMLQFEYSGWTSKHTYWTNHLPTMIKGFESVASEPAWQTMRNMRLHPTNAPLADGSIMSGNVFTRNIVAWTNDAAKLVRYGQVSPANNRTDTNLYWHAGLPLKTGERGAGREAGANLAPNPGFEDGVTGQLPKDWTWQIRPKNAAASVVEGGAGGKRALRIDAAFDAGKERDNYPILVGRELVLTPGKSYRLRGKFKSTGGQANASLMLQSYRANVYFWASGPNSVRTGTQWQEADFTFKIPAPGEKGFHPEMKTFRVRVDWPAKTGTLFVDDVSLREAEAPDEWVSWRALGYDTHSLVADPQFENWRKDDFRLKSGSPAFKVGFERIPVEKIGPYANELRASWPIVEAVGAREKPLVTAH